MSDSSFRRRYDYDTEMDNYPSSMNNFSPQNTYEPYTNRYTSQSTYPKSRIDEDPLSIIGHCIVGYISMVFILCALVACSPLICCCCVLASCLLVFSSDSERTRYSNRYRSLYRDNPALLRRNVYSSWD